jgi:hypothetical protein
MRYVFDDCMLDTQQYELRRRGVRLPLRRKVFQVLVALIEQRHRVVCRDELLAREQRFVAREAEATRLQGWALAMQGQEEGLLLIRQGVAAAHASGEVLQGFWPALLAEAYGRTGQPEAGLPMLAEYGVRSLQHEERLGEAELYRLTGELLLQAGEHRHTSAIFSAHDLRSLPASPEACFLQALAIARTQQAKSLELRAAISLGRLWQRQGKHTAAHQLLTEVYGWFTEGFDTADLQEAQTLLADLAAESPTSSPDILPSPSAHNRLPIYATYWTPGA